MRSLPLICPSIEADVTSNASHRRCYVRTPWGHASDTISTPQSPFSTARHVLEVCIKSQPLSYLSPNIFVLQI